MRYGRIAGISGVFLIIIFGGLYLAAEHLHAPEVPPVSIGRSMDINGHKISLEISDTPAAREQGLSGRDSLAADSGMLFIFSVPGNYGFWMKGMKFPLDIVWIASDTVVGWEANVDPQIGVPENELKLYFPPVPVDEVLELPAGSAATLNLRKGQVVPVSGG